MIDLSASLILHVGVLSHVNRGVTLNLSLKGQARTWKERFVFLSSLFYTDFIILSF